MPDFRLIEHTADIGIEAWGKTMAEAFGNAARGMFSIITELDSVTEAESRTAELAEESLEELLFEWLNALLYYFDVDGLLFKRFEVKLDGNSLQAECLGERYDPARHALKLGVKSATYHAIEVDEKNNCVRVIFDV